MANPPATLPLPIAITPLILIRPYTPTDAPAVAVAANNPLIAANMRNTFPSPYTLSTAENWITIANTPSPIYSSILHYGIFSPDNSQFYGGIGLMPRKDVESHVIEIGYWVGQSAWGRGIATAAVKEMCRWAFREFEGLGRLEGVVFGGNEGSRRVLEKSGFTLEGTRRKAVRKHGVEKDLLVFGLLREDWIVEEVKEVTRG
jgi:RimJ/RimL family protein N-acetyltransferase